MSVLERCPMCGCKSESGYHEPNCPIRKVGTIRYDPPKLTEIIPMLLWCPSCGKRHIEEGVFKVKPHHTHACQHCGMVWRPAIVATMGVEFLPGFKNGETP